MKMHASRVAGRNQFTAYGPDFVAVNGVDYRHSLVVTPERLRVEWPVNAVAALDAESLATLTAGSDAVLLLGTGATQSFPPLAVLRELAQRRIAVEVMDSQAACRTFNILMAEGRNVVAAIILPGVA